MIEDLRRLFPELPLPTAEVKLLPKMALAGVGWATWTTAVAAPYTVPYMPKGPPKRSMRGRILVIVDEAIF